MTCIRALELLSAYIDSELNPDDMLEVRSHLFKCDSCSQEFDRLKGTKSTLGSLRHVEPVDDLLNLIACRPWDLDDKSKRHIHTTRFANHSRVFKAVAVAVFVTVSAGVVGISGLFRIPGPASNLSEIFQAEHERFHLASPLAASPDTIELGHLADESSDDEFVEVQQPADDGFVTFVSHVTIR